VVFDPWEGTPLFKSDFQKQWVQHLCWSRDGNYLAAAAGKVLKVFSRSGKELLYFEGHESSVAGLSWGPGGLVSACFTAVRYFAFPFQQAPKAFHWPISLVSVSISPDGKFIGAGTQDSAIHFWPIPYAEGTDFEMSGYKGKAQWLQWSTDAKMLVTNCWNTLVCWSFNNGAPTGQQPIQLEARNERITAIQVSKDSSYILAGDRNGVVDVYDYKVSPRPVLSIPLHSEISCLQMTPDNASLLVGNKEGRLHLIADVPALIKALAAR
jgi:WD40 repeat protein